MRFNLKTYILILILISSNLFAAEMDSKTLCRKNSRFCVTYWKLKTPKYSAYWKSRRIDSLEISSKKLNKTSYERDISYLNSIQNRLSNDNECSNPILITGPGSSINNLCQKLLSKSEWNRVVQLFE